MSSIDFTAFSAALEKIILPTIRSQFYRRAPMWQLIGGWSAEEGVANRANVKVDRFENNQMYIPIRSGAHSGIVSIAPGETYNYGSPILNTTNSGIKTIVGSFTIQKQLLNTNNAGSIVKPLMYYSESLSNDMAKDANRQVYGDNSGTLATANAGVTSATLVLAASVNGDIDYAQYLPIGTVIKIGSNSAVTVTAVTALNTVTISASQTWSAADAIIKQTGSTTASSELDGLKGMIAASGAYQNLNASADATWKSTVNSTTESITTSNIQSKMHNQYFAANRIGHVDWIVMNSHAFQMFGNSLTQFAKFEGSEVLNGGWRGLQYMGGAATILLDYDCPDDRIYFLSSEDLVFGEYQTLEFERGTDGTLLKLAGKLDYEVTASWMGNIGTTSRGAHALMSNKTF